MEQKIWKTLLALIFILQIIFIFLNISLAWFYTKGWMLVLAACLSALLLFAFPIATIIYKTWSAITNFIGAIISRLILTVIYFLVLWPISILRKLTGKEKCLFRKKSSAAESYFTDSLKTFKSPDFKNTW